MFNLNTLNISIFLWKQFGFYLNYSEFALVTYRENMVTLSSVKQHETTSMENILVLRYKQK